MRTQIEKSAKSETGSDKRSGLQIKTGLKAGVTTDENGGFNVVGGTRTRIRG